MMWKIFRTRGKNKLLLIAWIFSFISSCSTVSSINTKEDKYKTEFRLHSSCKHFEQMDNRTYVHKSNRSESKKVKIYKVPVDSVYVNKKKLYFSLSNQSNNILEFKNTKGKIKFSVENMPVYEFVNFVFGKILRVNYIIDDSVKKMKDKVNLSMEESVPEKEFFGMLRDVFSKYGIEVTKNNNDVFLISRRTEKRKSVVGFFIGRKLPDFLGDDEYVTVFIPFYYIRADYYINILRQMILSKNSEMHALPQANVLVITDKVCNIKKAVRFIDTFDKIVFENKKAFILKLNYISPLDFIEKLKKLLPLEGIPVSQTLRMPGIIMVPLPEISSVFILASKAEWLKYIIYWKEKFDTVSALGDKPRLFIFYPNNRRASELVKVFNELKMNSSMKKKSNVMRIAADESRNAIVVFATPYEYERIRDALKKLDTLPKEVLVQVTIAEVTLTKNLQYGVEWYLKHSGRFKGILETKGGLGIGASGLNYSVITDTEKFKAFINMYAKKNLINVISSPRLVVLDNHEATINVGTQVPTVTSETNSANVQTEGTTSLLRTIQYRNTGVILTIKPTINSNGILTLTINQEVSEPQVNNTSKIDSPIILDRSIQTSVVLKSGMTLLLGGLMKNNRSYTENKVPILGDVPLIGELFKTTSKGNVKTELIVEITPYIISNMEEAIHKTQSFEKLLKWFEKNK